jgi:hypothetical protein
MLVVCTRRNKRETARIKAVSGGKRQRGMEEKMGKKKEFRHRRIVGQTFLSAGRIAVHLADKNVCPDVDL